MNKDDKKPFLARINDKYKIAFLRFWFVGLIYYLVGWGTDLGSKDNPYDLILVLAIVIGVGHILLFNPIINKMFDIERNGKIINKKIEERKVWQGVCINLLEFFKCFLITILVYLTYELINYILISILQISKIPVPGEPILFGLFFSLYYQLINFIRDKIYYQIEKRRGEKNG